MEKKGGWMYRKILLLSALVVCICLVVIDAYSEVVELEGKAVIKEVTVYSEAALVTRSLSVKVPAGKSRITVEKLPPWVTERNTTFAGSGNFLLVSSEFIRQAIFVEPDEDGKLLEKTKEELEQRRRELELRESVLKTKMESYHALAPRNYKISGNSAELKDFAKDDVEKLLQIIDVGLTDIARKTREIAIEKREIDKQLDELNERMRNLNGHTDEYRKVALIVKAAEESTISIKLKSLVGDCSWNPTYDVRISEDKSVSFSYYANVWQRTKEDWNDVKVTLSTSGGKVGYPAEVGSITLNGQKIQRRTSAPYTGVTMPPTTNDWRTMPRSGRESGGRPSQAPREAQSKANKYGDGIAVEFELDAKATIIGNGGLRRLLIVRKKMEGKYEYNAAPRLEEHAFAVVEIKNDTSYPFIGGKMRTFSGGALLGTTDFQAVALGERFELFLHDDPVVEVRCLDYSLVVDEGSRKKDFEFSWVLQVRNNRDRDIVVNLSDALPSVKNDEIKLKSVKFTMDPINKKTWEEDKNRIVKWKLLIPAGETVRVGVSFKVVAPTENELYWNGAWNEGAK